MAKISHRSDSTFSDVIELTEHADVLTSIVDSDEVVANVASKLSENTFRYDTILKGAQGSDTQKIKSSELISSRFISQKLLYLCDNIRFFPHFPDLSEKAINTLLDLCEDEVLDVRKQAIKDLPGLCKYNIENVERISDILTQLLQATDPQESSMVRMSLLKLTKIDPTAAIKGIFHQVENGEPEAREQAISFMVSRFKQLPVLFWTSHEGTQQFLLKKIKEMMDDVSGDEFIQLIKILSALPFCSSTINGQRELLSIIVDMAELDIDFEPQDYDCVDKCIQCGRQAVNLFNASSFTLPTSTNVPEATPSVTTKVSEDSSVTNDKSSNQKHATKENFISSAPFVSYLIDYTLPLLHTVSNQTEDGYDSKLEILKLLAELSNYCPDIGCVEERLSVVHSKLIEFMPSPSSSREVSPSDVGSISQNNIDEKEEQKIENGESSLPEDHVKLSSDEPLDLKVASESADQNMTNIDDDKRETVEESAKNTSKNAANIENEKGQRRSSSGSNKVGEEPDINLSYLECLLYTFHQLSRKKTDFLSAKTEESKKRSIDFRERLQYCSRLSQKYTRKLRTALLGLSTKQLRETDNKLRLIALKMTTCIQTIIKDILHTPPRYSAHANLSWKPLRKKDMEEKARSSIDKRGEKYSARRAQGASGLSKEAVGVPPSPPKFANTDETIRRRGSKKKRTSSQNESKTSRRRHGDDESTSRDRGNTKKRRRERREDGGSNKRRSSKKNHRSRSISRTRRKKTGKTKKHRRSTRSSSRSYSSHSSSRSRSSSSSRSKSTTSRTPSPSRDRDAPMEYDMMGENYFTYKQQQSQIGGGEYDESEIYDYNSFLQPMPPQGGYYLTPQRGYYNPRRMIRGSKRGGTTWRGGYVTPHHTMGYVPVPYMMAPPAPAQPTYSIQDYIDKGYEFATYSFDPNKVMTTNVTNTR